MTEVKDIWSLSWLLCIFHCLSSVVGDNSTLHSGNVTETTSSTTPEAVLPNRTSEWEKHVLYNLMIIAVVVLIIIGAVFLLRYMRAEKKLTKRRYERLSKAEEDDDIELSIYEKK